MGGIRVSHKDLPVTFQDRVQPWMTACFGAEISGDKVERGDRLLEEVLELLQSGGYDPARVAALRDYVWSRPAGEPSQEVGGVQVTLAAYCLAFGLNMHEAGETELARIWTKVEKIRAKQAAKPAGSALPVAAPVQAPVAPVAVKPRRMFPILSGGGQKIDWQLVADHSNQAKKNHYQSVERLAERGGLSWCELYAVLHNKEWEKKDENEAIIACRALEARYLAALSSPQGGVPEGWRPTHRHVKRGSSYQQIGLASLQCTESCAETAVLVIYRGDDGKLWARPHDEFNDGRFEAIDAAGGAI
ncbi:hypothetical protein [Mesorhizobium sp.]|uniref:hypothetical protein n=1 Tax=Mesorhizobium sp. TaxID=1871066 RepID=UPI0025E49DB4|nr:hypothetical protein [Mesorhizobium sp.]